jgi:predicted transcriptional regulator YdeE
MSLREKAVTRFTNPLPGNTFPRIMNLVEASDVEFPETHLVYAERIGPPPEVAPRAWKELTEALPQIEAQNKVVGFLALYKLEPEMVYRAGVSTALAAEGLPEGLIGEVFKGGKYARYVHTGPWSELGAATTRAFELFGKRRKRSDWHIERYLTKANVQPAITEILIPV